MYKYNSSLCARGKLFGAVKVEQVFPTYDNIRAVKGGIRDGKKDWDATNDAKLQGVFSNQYAFEKRLILCAKHMGACLSIWGTTVTGIVIAATEFRDFYVLVTTFSPLTSKTNVTVS